MQRTAIAVGVIYTIAALVGLLGYVDLMDWFGLVYSTICEIVSWVVSSARMDSSRVSSSFSAWFLVPKSAVVSYISLPSTRQDINRLMTASVVQLTPVKSATAAPWISTGRSLKAGWSPPSSFLLSFKDVRPTHKFQTSLLLMISIQMLAMLFIITRNGSQTNRRKSCVNTLYTSPLRAKTTLLWWRSPTMQATLILLVEVTLLAATRFDAAHPILLSHLIRSWYIVTKKLSKVICSFL